MQISLQMSHFILPLRKVLFFSFLFFLISCVKNKDDILVIEKESIFTLLKSEETGIDFTNRSIETASRNLAHYDYFYNGSGVSIGDINNDGLADIFFAGNDADNNLYLNKGNLEFEDISKDSGIVSRNWATGVSMVDINEDGLLDIYVCNSGPYVANNDLANELYINNGDLTFTESAALYGIDDTSYSSQATFFDMDKDGDLDLFVMNHSLISYGKNDVEWEKEFLNKDVETQKKSSSTLYRNNGDNSFTDITKEAGILKPGFGLGIAVSDFDENGFLDIYISNDYFLPDYLFFNLGGGKFVENIKAKVSHSSFYSMGCDAADFNNDGLIDLAVVDMTPSDHYRGKTLMESMDVNRFKYLVKEKDYLPQYMFNTLQLNRSKGNFSEIGQQSGIAQTDWSWAPLLVDLNNDSLKDLIITNGFKRDTKDRDWANDLNESMTKDDTTEETIFNLIKKSKSTPTVNYIFKNKGNLDFEDNSNEWGFNEPSFSQGAAYGDLDNDGDLDVVINNLESKAFVYQNNTIENTNTNYIQFTLSDQQNSSKIMHSKIKVYTGSQVQMCEYSFVRGYLSSMQPIAHFGLGKEDVIDKVEVIWPDGTLSTIEKLKINEKHNLDKNELTSNSSLIDDKILPFMDVAKRVNISDYKHDENYFNDYREEILLPHKQSTLGPSIAVGDVNGDGFDDFYVGGAKGQAGQLYFQDLKKGFVKSSSNVFIADASFEDLGALFFDADNDNDLDLYVASGGGGDVKETRTKLQDRLYINGGNGIFTKSKNKLPLIESSTASIQANDWDNDGDLDLFVGGRTLPGKYPFAPMSYLLENKEGDFKDVTNEYAPELRKAGMVTSSCWTDFNGDGLQDLIIVGEWMPIKVFLNTQNGFKETTKKYNFSNNVGWWYSINKGDFDNDGDDDFIVGNIGKNNKFNPSLEKPLHIFANDFDGNGTQDIVLSKLYKNYLAPIRGKECSADQMPFINKKYPKFSDFASSSLDEIYGAENLNDALHYKATNFASLYIENRGDGTFKSRELPAQAQIAPIQDIIVWDFDKDGNLDVVIAGNVINTEVETSAYDAGKGLFLKGKGDGTFLPYSKIAESGIFMPQNVKNLKLLMLLKEKRPSVLVANNNSNLNLFTWTK